MPVPIRQYRDIDLDFAPHPITGELAVLTDRDAVRRSLRNLVLTANYERPHQPWLGSVVNSSLFAPANALTEQKIRTSIEDAAKLDKRVEVKKIDLNYQLDRNGYDVVITFKIKNIPDLITLEMFLRRTR